MSEVPDALEYLQGRGLSIETIEERKLGVSKGPHYRGWLTIPYHDAMGRRRMTRFRTLHGDKEYRTLKGEGRHLYNVCAVENPTVAICEGEFDSMILSQLGFCAVAIPGAKAWQREWRWLFRNTDLVLVITDEDEAGIAARARILSSLHQVTTAESVSLPEGMDITDLYLKNPKELERALT